jgi:hypothetical protein
MESRHWWVTPVILATWESEIRRIVVLDQVGQIVRETPISKIIREKWTGVVTQSIGYLLCKHEALCLNPVHQKKKKKPYKNTTRKHNKIYHIIETSGLEM